MAQLTLIYDTAVPPVVVVNIIPSSDVKIAVLPLSDALTELDVYEVARRLAELLLEQMTR